MYRDTHMHACRHMIPIFLMHLHISKALGTESRHHEDFYSLSLLICASVGFQTVTSMMIFKREKK